ncbi:MAG: indolepyruvate oxidoreductase subunit beta [Planctomycetota bacterium]
MSRPGRRLKIVFSGYGGQGVLTASQILGRAATFEGHEVTAGQLHGMSQRGGSVESTVLIGPGKSAFVGVKEADVVVGFEPLETLRSAPKMNARTLVLMNIDRSMPSVLARAGKPYPDLDGIVDQIRATAGSVVLVNGPEITRAAGAGRTLNVAMLGALAGADVLPFSGEALFRAVAWRCPERFLSANRLAFDLGMKVTCISKRPE